ncbi:MAG: bifunctional riboflavin kinase/FAD synthetase [Candidatus Margulisiibacteriota bacterium]
MRIVRHPKKGKLHRPVVALGTFDGVHLGHKKIIEAAVSFGRKIKSHTAVLTFDPHPQEIVAPQRGLRKLTTLREREDLFVGLGIDAVVVFRFTHHLQKLTPREFVKRYLVDRLGVRWVFVGYDYAFGRKRLGGVAELKKLGKEFKFGVTVIPPVKVEGQIVKSGKIRQLLAEGKFKEAIKMLGHPYRLVGKVVRGAGRGKLLGFPTANLKVDPAKLLPAHGVYVGYVDGKKCVVNIGSRPTFGVDHSLVEVHILNFNQKILGKELRVDLFSRLREEKQFSDVAALCAQIRKDIARARRM